MKNNAYVTVGGHGMKKLLGLVILLVAVFTLAGCENNDTQLKVETSSETKLFLNNSIIEETVVEEEIIEEDAVWTYALRENRITTLDTFTTYCNVLEPNDCSVHQDYIIELVWETEYTFFGTYSELEDIVNRYLDSEDFNDNLFVGATLYAQNK